MSGPARLGVRICTVGFALAMTVAACAGHGELNIVNNGADVVKVSTGDQALELSSNEGAVILDYGCTPGDVTVDFTTSGRRVVVPGPLCPGEQLVVGDEDVHVLPVDPAHS